MTLNSGFATIQEEQFVIVGNLLSFRELDEMIENTVTSVYMKLGDETHGNSVPASVRR